MLLLLLLFSAPPISVGEFSAPPTSVGEFPGPPISVGEANLPTLPEAVQLFQLESMNKKREEISNQEKEIREQQARITELEGDLRLGNSLIALMIAENTRLKEKFAVQSVEEKELEQCLAEKDRFSSPKRFSEFLERVENKLEQFESTNEYMGKVMLQNNKVML